MKRFLCLGVLTGAMALGPTAIAQQQVATTAPPPAPNLGAGVRAGARVGARAQAFATTIQGNALSSTNNQLVNTFVRLRDARYGRILDSQLTDKSGLFAFRSVDPGSYIVEIMSADQNTVLAASQILNVNAGDVVSAVVKLPFRLPPFAGILGGNGAAAVTPASATAIVTQAAVNSVLIVATPATATPACPEQVF
ncbi:MAG TPA: hypothetical protein VFA27_06985 [Vicinamibacterales bacterium]|nr:hypothetical protein [Vicinamibacterales bacterium]